MERRTYAVDNTPFPGLSSSSVVTFAPSLENNRERRRSFNREAPAPSGAAEISSGGVPTRALALKYKLGVSEISDQPLPWAGAEPQADLVIVESPRSHVTAAQEADRSADDATEHRRRAQPTTFRGNITITALMSREQATRSTRIAISATP
jgi:hypothetical protein